MNLWTTLDGFLLYGPQQSLGPISPNNTFNFFLGLSKLKAINLWFYRDLLIILVEILFCTFWYLGSYNRNSNGWHIYYVLQWMRVGRVLHWSKNIAIVRSNREMVHCNADFERYFCESECYNKEIYSSVSSRKEPVEPRELQFWDILLDGYFVYPVSWGN